MNTALHTLNVAARLQWHHHKGKPVNSEECSAVKTGTTNQARTTMLVGTYDFLYTSKRSVMVAPCVTSVGVRFQSS